MVIPKIMGTETEYGIAVKAEANFDPITYSIMVVNSYHPGLSPKIYWDYDQESPLTDARGFDLEEQTKMEVPNQEENITTNKVLYNGARLYVDHAHPEYSTPECSNVTELIMHEKAGEKILEMSRVEASQRLPSNREILLYKNNSDKKGNSYGYHENYLMSRATSFKRIAEVLIPFLVTRQIFTGAGKVGSENGTDATHFQISQRADFIETEIGLDTMSKRPIINTRDEPHANKEKYRRLHLILGDANMSEVSTYLKIGVTALILSMIEEGAIHLNLEILNPIQAIVNISHDLSCRKRVECKGGKNYSALEIQMKYLEEAHRYLSKHHADKHTVELIKRWEDTLRKLAQDPLQLNWELDWVIKFYLLNSYRKERKLDWDHPTISMMDLQYHDLRQQKGLYYLLEKEKRVTRVITDQDIYQAIESPPANTRAYFRGMCRKKYGPFLQGVNWDSISFCCQDGNVKRIFMLEPMKGSKALVKDVLDNSDDIDSLIKNLSG